jgi:hypothetical protein
MREHRELCQRRLRAGCPTLSPGFGTGWEYNSNQTGTPPTLSSLSRSLKAGERGTLRCAWSITEGSGPDESGAKLQSLSPADVRSLCCPPSEASFGMTINKYSPFVRTGPRCDRSWEELIVTFGQCSMSVRKRLLIDSTSPQLVPVFRLTG